MRTLPILFSTDMVRALLEERKTVTRRVVKGAEASWSFVGLDRDPAVFRVRADGEACPKEVKGLYATFEADPGVWFPMFKAPYEPGDILYVRETWCPYDKDHVIDGKKYAYGADATVFSEPVRKTFGYKWRPSIHMPKEAARIFIKVKSIMAERLQDSFFAPISPIFELLAEGMNIGDDCRHCINTYGNPCCVDTVDEDGSNLYGGDCGILDEIRGEYSDLWNRLYAKPMPVKEHGVVVRYESYPWEDIQKVRTYRGLPWLVIGNPWVWVIEFERTDKPEGWR